MAISSTLCFIQWTMYWYLLVQSILWVNVIVLPLFDEHHKFMHLSLPLDQVHCPPASKPGWRLQRSQRMSHSTKEWRRMMKYNKERKKTTDLVLYSQSQKNDCCVLQMHSLPLKSLQLSFSTFNKLYGTLSHSTIICYFNKIVTPPLKSFHSDSIRHLYGKCTQHVV